MSMARPGRPLPPPPPTPYPTHTPLPTRPTAGRPHHHAAQCTRNTVSPALDSSTHTKHTHIPKRQTHVHLRPPTTNAPVCAAHKRLGTPPAPVGRPSTWCTRQPPREVAWSRKMDEADNRLGRARRAAAAKTGLNQRVENGAFLETVRKLHFPRIAKQRDVFSAHPTMLFNHTMPRYSSDSMDGSTSGKRASAVREQKGGVLREARGGVAEGGPWKNAGPGASNKPKHQVSLLTAVGPRTAGPSASRPPTPPVWWGPWVHSEALVGSILISILIDRGEGGRVRQRLPSVKHPLEQGQVGGPKGLTLVLPHLVLLHSRASGPGRTKQNGQRPWHRGVCMVMTLALSQGGEHST